MKRTQRIKLILDLIKNKRHADPEKETFLFQYEEFTKLPLLSDQVMLTQLFKRIQEESRCIIFIFPKIPEYQTEKPEKSMTIYEITDRIATYKLLNNLSNKDATLAITIHIEDLVKFDRYCKVIEEQLEEKNPALILNNEGSLYRIDTKGKEYLYPMVKTKSRYKIIHYLATEKRWVQSRELAEECEMNPKKIGKTIEQIRRQIEKFIKIKGNRIIESKKGLGYRAKNIKIKKN